MLKIFLKIVQFIIGFILGILIFSGVSLGAAYFVYTKLANIPPKPVYAGEQPAPPAVAVKTSPPLPVASQPKQTPTTSPSPSPTPQPVEASLQPGTYKAQVLRGLNIRSEPSAESQRLGGLYYKDQIIVLQSNNDQSWQKIRVVTTGQEGWIKSGNIKKLE